MADFRLLVLDASGALDGAAVEADLVTWNKADLCRRREPGRLYISAKSGEGIDTLISRIAGAAANSANGPEPPLLTRARHRYSVEEASERIAAALEEREPELAAEQLRVALRALGRITGAVDIDELLDIVFRDFCIGK
jgi:tRNA modification GTPase